MRAKGTGHFKLSKDINAKSNLKAPVLSRHARSSHCHTNLKFHIILLAAALKGEVENLYTLSLLMHIKVPS